MSRPIVERIGNARLIEDRSLGSRPLVQNASCCRGSRRCFATDVAGAPGVTDVGALLETVDGVVLTGARANVHPTRFNAEPHRGHEPYDEDRDALALELIKVLWRARYQFSVFARGFQEMNVAFRGTLHHEIRELPGRMNHRMPRLKSGEIHPDPEVIFGDRHEVRLLPEGVFAQIFGREIIRVNSLHGQGILEPGNRIIVEGMAEDGTIEAIQELANAPGFALGVRVMPSAIPNAIP